MLKQLARRLRVSRLLHSLIWVSAGRFLNSTLAFLTGIIITRTLGAAEFGLFSFSVAVLIVAMELAASQGLNNGLVHFASIYLGRDANRADRFFKVALITKVGAAVLLLVASLLIVEPIFTYLLDKPELKASTWFGIIGACFASLWWYTLAVLQTRRSFGKYALLNLVPNILTVTVIGSRLIFVNRLSLDATLMANVLGFLAGFMVGLLFIPRQFLSVKGKVQKTAWQLFHYSKWTTLASLMSALYHRLDILMVGFFVEPDILGYYAAAATIAAGLYLLYDATVTVLLPNASRLSGRGQYLNFIRKSLLMTTGLCLMVTPIFILARPLIVTVYTEKFLPSVPILRVLFLGLIFTMLLEPLFVILYARAKPQWITAVNFSVVIIYIAGNLLLIPRYGVMGAASMSVVSRLLSGGIILALVYYEMMKMKLPGAELEPYPVSIGHEP